MLDNMNSNTEVSRDSQVAFEPKANGASFHVKTLNRPEGRLVYEDSEGSGELLILLPGAGDLRSEYRFLAPKLLEAGYRVVMLDLRGHGDSDAGFSDYGLAAHAQDLLSLIDQLNSGAATVIGTSFSPAVALWAAAQAPEKIKSLVLISAHIHDASAFENFMLSTLLRGPWKARLWESFYRSWYPSRKPEDLAAYGVKLRANLSTARRAKAVRETLTASRQGLAERLVKLDLPVLVMMGGKDNHFKNPLEEAEMIAQKVSGELVMLEGAGHYPHAEMPEKAAGHILSFLQNH